MQDFGGKTTRTVLGHLGGLVLLAQDGQEKFSRWVGKEKFSLMETAFSDCEADRTLVTCTLISSIKRRINLEAAGF